MNFTILWWNLLLILDLSIFLGGDLRPSYQCDETITSSRSRKSSGIKTPALSKSNYNVRSENGIQISFTSHLINFGAALFESHNHGKLSAFIIISTPTRCEHTP
jgi:hypothetical protein